MRIFQTLKGRLFCSPWSKLYDEDFMIVIVFRKNEIKTKMKALERPHDKTIFQTLKRRVLHSQWLDLAEF